jgi:hypothetical protein
MFAYTRDLERHLKKTGMVFVLLKHKCRTSQQA